MYLIWFSFIHLYSSFFTLRLTLNFILFCDQDTIQCNQAREMQSMNLREINVGSHRPNSPVANLGGPSNIVEDEVDFRGHFTLPIGVEQGPMPRGHIQFHPNMIVVHKSFRAKIDNLSISQMCHVFQELYPGIQVVRGSEGPICKRCKQGERFPSFFSMESHGSW
jgi:hypothetical protein